MTAKGYEVSCLFGRLSPIRQSSDCHPRGLCAYPPGIWALSCPGLCSPQRPLAALERPWTRPSIEAPPLSAGTVCPAALPSLLGGAHGRGNGHQRALSCPESRQAPTLTMPAPSSPPASASACEWHHAEQLMQPTQPPSRKQALASPNSKVLQTPMRLCPLAAQPWALQEGRSHGGISKDAPRPELSGWLWYSRVLR